jgi:cell division protein FtsL
VIAFDKDAETMAAARETLRPFGDRVRLVHADFREAPRTLGTERADGILLDLGVSSAQLDDASRGFSFREEGPLDMRMDRSDGPTAADLVNRLPEDELANLIYRYGEERASRRIARAIAEARKRRHFATTLELASVVRRAAGRSRRPGLDPATQTFQALRIAVNGERGWALPEALASRLPPGGAWRDRLPQPGGPRGQADLPLFAVRGLSRADPQAGPSGTPRDVPQPPISQRAPAGAGAPARRGGRSGRGGGMRDDGLGGVMLLPKSIDNSKVVREVDPRSSRDLFWLLALVALLVGGLVLYAWPHFELRQAGLETEQLQREKDRLIEENRKLRLEKASYESLARVETIATRDLGLVRPPADQLVVVEQGPPVADGERLASAKPAPAEAQR